MKETVLTAGVFDLLHHGHLNLLRACRRIAGDGRLVVAVNSDEFTFFYKREYPHEPEMLRLANIRELALPDESFILPAFQSQSDILEKYAPCIVVHGDEWRGPALYQQFGVDKKWLDDRGILFVYVDRTEGVSSTELRERLK